MNTYDIKQLDRWNKPIGPQTLQGDVLGSKFDFRVTTLYRAACSIQQSEPGGSTPLVICEPGLTEVRFTARGVVTINFVFMDGEGNALTADALTVAQQFISWDYLPPVDQVEGVDEDAYTELQPAGNKNTDADRIMMLARYNAAQLLKNVQAEVEAMRNEFGTPKADPNVVIEGPGSTEEPSEGGN